MDEESKKLRFAAISHLRGAIMQIEGSMAADSGSWTYDQVSVARMARNLVKTLVDELHP